MKQKLFIALSVTLLSFVIIWACKEEELPEFSGINKVELTITADSTSYVFSEINCNLNQKPKFTVEQHGFCWDTLSNVTIEKQKSNNGSLNTQNFEETIENLLPNKTYYVKAYVQNQEAIIYSNELSIQTLDAKPIVTTNDIINIQANSAQSGGNANAYEALFPITQRGVCWAKTQNPTIADSLTLNGTGNGAFVSNIQNLEIGETYFARAYAINSQGINYGNEKTFSTLDGIPELTTDSIRNITATSATFYGNIIENDGLPILEKGFCWNTNTNPTIANSLQIVGGNNLGSFNTTITGLAVNTTFYCKAYIKNATGTFYGNEISFTTKDGLPSIITTPISNITLTSAQSGGNILNDGGFEISSCGICWDTMPNPSIANNIINNVNGIGLFTSLLTNLEINSTYYLRAFATNEIGTAYGNELNFITKNTIEDYDGNEYTIVKIGTQIWMKENLKTKHYSDGRVLFDGTNSGDLTGDYNSKYYFYLNDNPNNFYNYGLLYTWAAAMDGGESSINNPSEVQGICPDGWHLPSDIEWDVLAIFISNENGGYSQIYDGSWEYVGGHLKAVSGWPIGDNGTDNYGFMGLPSGSRVYSGWFPSTSTAHFWSTTEDTPDNIWKRGMGNNLTFWRLSDSKASGFSVRCIKD